jgi:SAM-dependent methyltransferase
MSRTSARRGPHDSGASRADGSLLNEVESPQQEAAESSPPARVARGALFEKSRDLLWALERLLPLEEVKTVVEVGCGRGALALRLADRLQGSGEVLAFDVDRQAVRLASKQAAAAGLTNVEFREGDAYALPLDGDSADVVLCSSLLCTLDRARDAVVEMQRVVREGGFQAAAEPVATQLAHDPDDARFTRLSERLNGAFHRGWQARGKNPRIGLELPGMFLGAGLEDVAADAICQVHLLCDPRRGFREIVDQLTTEAAPLPEATAAMVVKGGMSKAELKEHHRRAEKRLEDFYTDPGGVPRSGYLRMTAPLIVVAGRKPGGG